MRVLLGHQADGGAAPPPPALHGKPGAAQIVFWLGRHLIVDYQGGLHVRRAKEPVTARQGGCRWTVAVWWCQRPAGASWRCSAGRVPAAALKFRDVSGKLPLTADTSRAGGRRAPTCCTMRSRAKRSVVMSTWQAPKLHAQQGSSQAEHFGLQLRDVNCRHSHQRTGDPVT